MNSLFDAKISLLEPQHKYILEEDPSINFISVTQIIENYFEPFDKYSIAQKLVTTSPKYLGMDPDELIKKWEATAQYGTKVHKEIESYILNNKPPDDIKAERGVEWIKKYIDDSNKVIYPEIIVFNKELRIAGSIDIIIYDKALDQYEIVDWKTSKKIDMTSYNNKMGSHPISQHLMDCRFVHYSLQLSFYRYLIEEYYNLNVSNHSIAHLTDQECSIIKCNYYKEEVVKIIADN